MFTAWYKKTAQHDLHGERFVYFIFLTDFKFRFKIGVIGEKNSSTFKLYCLT